MQQEYLEDISRVDSIAIEKHRPIRHQDRGLQRIRGDASMRTTYQRRVEWNDVQERSEPELAFEQRGPDS